MRACQAGEMDKAKEQQWCLVGLAVPVTVTHGVGGLKAAMAMAGYQPGVVRSPLTMPDDTAREVIEKELATLGY